MLPFGRFRLRANEVLRLTLAAILGVLAKTGYDVLWNYECHRCQLDGFQAVTEGDDVIRNIEQLQLHEPYKPLTTADNIKYHYFNNKYLYDGSSYHHPRRDMRGAERAELGDVISQAIMLIKTIRHHLDSAWKFKSLQNGLKRLDPIRGHEFILDLNGQVKGNPVTYRVELVKPFMSAQLVQYRQYMLPRPVHLVLPLVYNTSAHLLSRWMTSYELCCLRTKAQVTLFVILYTGRSEFTEVLGRDLQNMVINVKNRYQKARVRFMHTRADASRSALLELGSRQIAEDELMVLADVSTAIRRDFLDRCRYNSVYTRRVYYPIHFSQHYTQNNRLVPVSRLELNHENGDWLHDNYDTVCLYNRDYRFVQGLNTSIKVWGLATRDLHTRHLKAGFQVIRSPDPGLITLDPTPLPEPECPPSHPTNPTPA